MVRKKFAMMSELRVELNNFRAVDLISSARSLAEKILWSLIAILGTVWIGFIVLYQMQYWDENPVLVTKGVKSLSGLHQPALTFCHRGMQKFGLVERMVNYIDLTKDIPKEVFEIRNVAIKAQYLKVRRTIIDLLGNFCKLMSTDTRFYDRFPNTDGCEVRLRHRHKLFQYIQSYVKHFLCIQNRSLKMTCKTS